MQSETGFPSSHQLKSYVASKSHVKLAARAVLSADAGLLVALSKTYYFLNWNRFVLLVEASTIKLKFDTQTLTITFMSVSGPSIIDNSAVWSLSDMIQNPEVSDEALKHYLIHFERFNQTPKQPSHLNLPNCIARLHIVAFN